MGIGKFQHPPHKINSPPLNRSTTKSAQLITCAMGPPIPNLIVIYSAVFLHLLCFLLQKFAEIGRFFCWVTSKNDFENGSHSSSWILKFLTFGHVSCIGVFDMVQHPCGLADANLETVRLDYPGGHQTIIAALLSDHTCIWRQNWLRWPRDYRRIGRLADRLNCQAERLLLSLRKGVH